MKPNHKSSHMMSVSFIHDQKSATKWVSVLFPFLRHLNMGSLALMMLVALAFLSATRGEESETNESAIAGATKSEVIIDKHHEFIGAVRPETSDYRTESAQGYLKVYSATDEFNDGGLAHYLHSSYAIYTADGKLFKRVENHRSHNDESPELVALPAGSYIVIARSDRHGDVGIRVAIKASQLTVLDLDIGEKETLRRRLSQTFLNLVKSLAGAADAAQRQVA
jgi:hypothetical protein